MRPFRLAIGTGGRGNLGWMTTPFQQGENVPFLESRFVSYLCNIRIVSYLSVPPLPNFDILAGLKMYGSEQSGEAENSKLNHFAPSRLFCAFGQFLTKNQEILVR